MIQVLPCPHLGGENSKSEIRKKSWVSPRISLGSRPFAPKRWVIRNYTGFWWAKAPLSRIGLSNTRANQMAPVRKLNSNQVFELYRSTLLVNDRFSPQVSSFGGVLRFYFPIFPAARLFAFRILELILKFWAVWKKKNHYLSKWILCAGRRSPSSCVVCGSSHTNFANLKFFTCYSFVFWFFFVALI